MLFLSEINLENSLLEVYRKLILYPNSSGHCQIQHPLYSFYHSEFCRLNERPHNKKFLENAEEKQFDEMVREVLMKSEASSMTATVLNLIRESLCRPDADVEKIIGALIILEFYVRNIITKPWKKEFHVILAYSGMFKIWIEPHLLGTDQMFRQFGYRRTAEGDKYIFVEQMPTVNLEKAAMFYRLAIVICFVVHFAQKRVNSPYVSLTTVFEAIQRVPASEHLLVSHLKDKFFLKDKLPRMDGSVTLGTSNIPAMTHAQVAKESIPITCQQDVTASMSRNVRSTGTQYDPTPEEDEDDDKFISANISIRQKPSDLKNLIQPTKNKSKHVKELSKGARARDVGHHIEEIQPTSYGFSHLPNKNFMSLSPEFTPIVDEEEDEEEVNITTQTPLSVTVWNRMKEDREQLKRMTFTTFKKHTSPDECCAVPRDVEVSIHPRPTRLRKGEEQDPHCPIDILSGQSKSSLEYLINLRSPDDDFVPDD